MKSIISRFVTERKIVADAIRFVEHAPDLAPSHVEFKYSTGWLGAHLDAAGIKGVGIRPMDYIKDPLWEIWYSLSVDDITYANWEKFAVAQINKGYDLILDAAIALNANWHQKDAWNCSEYWVAALLVAQIPILNVVPEACRRIDPDKAHLSNMLRGRGIYKAIDGRIIYDFR